MLEKQLVIVSNMINIKKKILLGIVLAIIIFIAFSFYVILKEGGDVDLDEVLPNKKATTTKYLNEENNKNRTTKISEPLTAAVCDLKNKEEREKCLNQIIVNESIIDEDLKR